MIKQRAVTETREDGALRTWARSRQQADVWGVNKKLCKMLSCGSNLVSWHPTCEPGVTTSFGKLWKQVDWKSLCRECDIHVQVICKTFRSVTLEPTILGEEPLWFVLTCFLRHCFPPLHVFCHLFSPSLSVLRRARLWRSSFNRPRKCQAGSHLLSSLQPVPGCKSLDRRAKNIET